MKYFIHFCVIWEEVGTQAKIGMKGCEAIVLCDYLLPRQVAKTEMRSRVNAAKNEEKADDKRYRCYKTIRKEGLTSGT